MNVIGLCGGSGSGKSTVASMFLSCGIPSIDADAVYHIITSTEGECLQQLREAFGSSVVRDGALNRRALADIVFADGAEDKRALLNSITHRHVLLHTRRVLTDMQREGISTVLFDAPLLFESGFDRECRACMCVVADVSVRVRRLIARDGITEEQARRRIAAQLSDDELRRRCRYCIDNSTDLASTERQVRSIATQLLFL